MTVKEIIEMALEEIGVLPEGEEAPGEMISSAMKRLNAMIGEWNTSIAIIPVITRESFSLPAQQSVTMYSGGDLDTNYALDILNLVITDSSNIKYTIRRKAEKDVRYITQVVSGTIPYKYAFLPNNDEGSILFDAIPPSGCTVAIQSLKPISSFTSLTASTDFPPGYDSALYLGLAVRLAAKYGKSLRQDTIALADKTLADIKRQNMRTRKPGELRTDHLPGVKTTVANIDVL